jgi:hypothetical protein
MRHEKCRRASADGETDNPTIPLCCLGERRRLNFECIEIGIEIGPFTARARKEIAEAATHLTKRNVNV